MQLTYKAVLHSDHIEWIDPPPDIADPIQVRITLLEEPVQIVERERGQAMAEALAGLANISGLSEIADPVEWQRALRQDRPLPGREP